jgi:hypothetical protein
MFLNRAYFLNLLLILIVCAFQTNAQIQDKDIVDLMQELKIIKQKKHKDTLNNHHFSLVPAAGYTLQTGFAILLASNLTFTTDKNEHSKTSTILSSVAYTQKNQIIFPIMANIWTKGNKYNIISDNKFLDYPSETYGIGPNAINSTSYRIDYIYLRLHETVLRKIVKNTYAGLGIFYDNFWNIKEIDAPQGIPSNLGRYGKESREETLGWIGQFLYDNRKNPINAENGLYASLIFRNNPQSFGNKTSWNSCTIEIRKYIPFPAKSKNTLALWSYNWLTFGGRVPYLLLPSTGWDDFFNTGRGYIQGRFKGGNMGYLEAEYRYRIMKNGLIGGTVFGNVQSFKRDIKSHSQELIPGYGLGLRIKMNKASSTNLSIDYGFGINGSRGFFVNLGEVF